MQAASYEETGPAGEVLRVIELPDPEPGPGEVRVRIIKTFAFRGATHLLTPEQGGAYLALRAASRMWELPSWQSYYGLAPGDWPGLREVVREALAGGPVTRDELGAAVTARRGYRHLGFAFADGAGTLLK